MKKLNKSHLWFALVAVAVFLLLLLIFTIFRSRLNNRLQSNAETQLSQNAAALSAVFYTKLDDQLIMLDSQARYFQNIDMTDYNMMKNTILQTKGVGGFKVIGVANASGATINYNGTSSGNIFLTDYYKSAMQGQNAISESIEVDEEGDEVLVLAVPIRRVDVISGAVYGTFTKSMLDELLESLSTSQDDAHLLISADGSILAKTTCSAFNKDASVIGDVIPGLNSMPDGSANVQYYTRNGQKYIAVLVPIGIHDWYFANILPESVVSEQTSQISVYVLIVIVDVVVVFLLILGYLMLIIRKNDRISVVNERFRLAAAQSHNVVFSYDFSTERMTVEGNAQLVIPHLKEFYTREDIEGYFALIHPEDKHVGEELKMIRTSIQSAVLSEFRLKCTDQNYYWFRMNASILRDDRGKPKQIIGSLFNVDEQMNKEMRLIERAQTDTLTGLLNKGAFHTRLSKELEERPRESVLAIFIIDLDNFKAVNDNLGHAMGDQVLSDVASKLSTIFGAKNTVGRIGGDEFAAYLLLEGMTPDKAESFIRQRAAFICRQLEETYAACQVEVEVSASVGIAVCPSDGIEYETLYRKSDEALYHAKKAGKKQYAYYADVV